jgi:hypothetical protein
LSQQLAAGARVGGAAFGEGGAGAAGPISRAVVVGGRAVGREGGAAVAAAWRVGGGSGGNSGGGVCRGFAAPTRRCYSAGGDKAGGKAVESKAAAEAAAAAKPSSAPAGNPLANRETTRTVADNPMAGMMFPWERAVLSG